jgi:rhamnogalacturonyl hydrolase YesR
MRAGSEKEVSGTAIFTMAIARGVRHGWLDATVYRPVVLRAWEALETEIDEDGTVHRICVGTMCSEDVEYYVGRPFYDNDTHGLFAVIFAGVEVQKLLESGR